MRYLLTGIFLPVFCLIAPSGSLSQAVADDAQCKAVEACTLSLMPEIFRSEITYPQCKTVEECARFAMEAAYEAKLALQVAIPIGAVMAFNRADCPPGWADIPALNGRVVIGSGKGENLTQRDWKQSGGFENVTLTEAQMPKHNHNDGEWGLLLRQTGNATTKGTDGSPGEPDINIGKSILEKGGGEPHPNMQPYYVLKYCERTH